MFYLRLFLKYKLKKNTWICHYLGEKFCYSRKKQPSLFSFRKILKPPKTPTKLLMYYGAVGLKNNSLISSVI